MDKNVALVIVIIIALLVIVGGALGIRAVLLNDWQMDDPRDFETGPSVEEQLLAQQVEAMRNQLTQQQQQYEVLVQDLRTKNQELVQRLANEETSTSTSSGTSLKNLDVSKIKADECDRYEDLLKDAIDDAEDDESDARKDLREEETELTRIRTLLETARTNLQKAQSDFANGTITQSVLDGFEDRVKDLEDDEDDQKDKRDDADDDLDDAEDDVEDFEDKEKEVKRHCRNL
jgi:uncharacterized membrane protein